MAAVLCPRKQLYPVSKKAQYACMIWVSLFNSFIGYLIKYITFNIHKRTKFLKVKLEENIYYDNSIRKYIFVVMLRIQKKQDTKIFITKVTLVLHYLFDRSNNNQHVKIHILWWKKTWQKVFPMLDTSTIQGKVPFMYFGRVTIIARKI